ncbi:MAG: hypothetical protein AAB393_18265 [Bacteroidota bacterium]
MKTHSVILFALAISFTVILSGCSVSHETMRGSIVMSFDKEAHICIGSEDGLQVGDGVTIYRVKQVPSTKEVIVPDRSSGYKPKMRYEKVKVGTARVTEILSEYYAAIELIEGELLANDIVEKSWRQ